MTAVAERPVATRVEPVAVASPERSVGWLAPVGAGISLLAVLVLGFGIYLFAFSSVQEARAQSNEYKSFRKALGEATAPVGPTRVGAPVAVLDIPAIGVQHAVVDEGTSSAVLTRGPGHRVNSPLPGQAGVAAIYARRTTFGGPFAHLPRLHYGDRIQVVTGQGTANYVVRDAGDGTHTITDAAPDRLLLITADDPLHPRHTLSISADLQGNPFPSDGTATSMALPAVDRALAQDLGALLPLMMWGLVLVAVTALWTVLRAFWNRRAGYLIIVPLLLASIWNVYENAAQLLPNVL